MRKIAFCGISISLQFPVENPNQKMIASSSSSNSILRAHDEDEAYGPEFEFPNSEKAKDRDSLLSLSDMLNKEIMGDAVVFKLDELPNLELDKTRSKLKEKQSLFQQRLETDKQSIKNDLLILHTYMKQTQKEEEWRNKLTQRAKLIQSQPKPEPLEISKPSTESTITPLETPPAISTPPTISVSPNFSPGISPQLRRRGTATEAKEHFDNSQMIEKMKEQWKKEKEEAIKKAEENNWTNTVSSKKNIWIFIICLIILSWIKQLLM